jgi:uncharacterized membrane protein YphA (DoxX/SURF4 family)
MKEAKEISGVLKRAHIRDQVIGYKKGDRSMKSGKNGEHKALNYTLWIIQGLLAALFLFAGVMKLVMPIETLTEQSPLPGFFLRFIGVAETLGAIGLILPGLLRIQTFLTPLAAAGLVIIMIGATVLILASGAIAPAILPLVVGLLSAFVAYGRWRVVPHKSKVLASVSQCAI